LCDEENRREDADELTAAGVALHTIVIRSVTDVAPELARLATALGLDEPPLEPLRPPAATTRRAFVPIWRRPWMTMNSATYGSSVLGHLGIGNVFGDDESRYPEITLADAVARRPDLVVGPSEPYPFGPRHVAELEQVAPVALVDGQDLFWWGVRTPAALRRLAQAL
jgi:hypothetical protein